jgi:signal transduction histidine kinase
MQQVTQHSIGPTIVGVLLAILLGSCTNNVPNNVPNDPSTEDRSDEFAVLIDSALVLRSVGRTDAALTILESIQAAAHADRAGRATEAYYEAVSVIAFDTENYDLSIYATMIRRGLLKDERFIVAVDIAMAHALKKSGDTVKAIQWYRKTAGNPHPAYSTDARRNMAWLFIATQHYDSTLYHMRVVRDVVRTTNAQYDGPKAWGGMIMARAYASLDSVAQAERELDEGLQVFERTPSYQLGDPTVRSSICRGVLDDSVRFIRAGVRWAPYRRRLAAIIDEAHSKASTLPQKTDRKPNYRQRLQKLLPMRTHEQPRPITTVDELEYLTGTAADRRSWQWVSTLSGTYLRAGDRLLALSALEEQKKPYRDVRILNDTLVQDGYDGVSNRMDLSSVVTQNPDSTAWLTTLQYNWHVVSWMGKPATAVVPTSGTADSLWFFFAHQFGKGTTFEVPENLKPLKTSDGRPWTDTVNHAIAVSDTLLVTATSRGVWWVNPHIGEMHQITLQPEGINSSRVNSVHLYHGRSLLTFESEATQEHPLLSLNPIRCAPGSYVYFLRGYERRLFSRFLIDARNPTRTMKALLPIRAITKEEEQPRYFDQYHPLLRQDSSLYLLLPHSVLVVDPRSHGMILSPVADSILGYSRRTHLQYADDHGSVGITSPHGLVIGQQLGIRRQPGGTLVAYKSLDAESYRVGSDGATINLDNLDRALELVVARPGQYGSVSLPLLLRLPWNDSTISMATGASITLTDIPAGEHRLLITAEDQPIEVPIVLNVEPTLAESTWFRVMTGATLLTLFVVGYQYVKLRRKRQQELREKDRLEERVAIGRDLHDAVGAELVRINMLAKTMAEHDTSTGIQRAVREANRNLRDVIWSVAEVHQLDAVVAILAERVRTTTEESGLEAHIMLPLEIPQLNVAPQVLRDITLIVTEALTNAIKHSRATVISYDVQVDDHGVLLRLEDNGVGFDIESPKTGLGVESMRQRALRSGLELSVVSQVDKGTTVRLILPNNNL